ncbi:MAG: glcB [Pseudonocardiales bacterium]|nr:glcB [Pseudonocardiales bacterium]
MSERTKIGTLQVATCLYDFIEHEALVGSGVDPAAFWSRFEQMVTDLTPTNRELLIERDRLQVRIDEWHRTTAGRAHDAREYRDFLTEIGYLLPEPDDFAISTTGVDRELSSVCGPQLVVPVRNARFALNAANARWGSLYDALYGTDAIADAEARRGGYDAARGARVIDYAKSFLDEVVPFSGANHAQVQEYRVEGADLVAAVATGETMGLVDPDKFRGFTGSPDSPLSVVLVNHGLHIELHIDRSAAIGRSDPAGLQDVVLEAAVTTIVDLEDSISAVDAADKVEAYRNWLALNRGDLSEEVTKDGVSFVRTLNADRSIVARGGEELVLPGRALLLVRNVGHLMTTDAVLDGNGDEIYEGILDAVVTTLGALPGLWESAPRRNGRAGSVYIVKPKMHGPAEVAFTAELFRRVEQLLGLAPNTVKLGVMDEERRTSVNLKACIREARDRIVFINTGFLDRSGDEIHTSFEAGPMVRKSDMKAQPWITAYEDHNVDVGLATGFSGRAQIGKGMWAMPDLMAAMIEQKIAHPLAGASTAWVPSPTAATLHAMHYHRVDVDARQAALRGTPRATVEDILRIPTADPAAWTDLARSEELDNNAQSILGYVVRWVDQGIGCSKVPDIHDVALMEDRATLRISSQLLANWLRHGVLQPDAVRESFERMARVVDTQNAADADYTPMSADYAGSHAFQAALELVYAGASQPNGYTEPILHKWRRRAKAARG